MAYDLGGVRPQRARRKLDGARVSARNLPVEPSWSCRRRAPRHGCQPCLRGSRPSSRVPSALSLSASRFRDTHSTRTVQPTGTCRAPATVAARVVWVRVADGTTTALHPGPGKEGPARVPQGTAGLSPFPGLSSYGWKAASFDSRAADHCPASKARDLIDLISAGGRTAPLSAARRELVVLTTKSSSKKWGVWVWLRGGEG